MEEFQRKLIDIESIEDLNQLELNFRFWLNSHSNVIGKIERLNFQLKLDQKRKDIEGV